MPAAVVSLPPPPWLVDPLPWEAAASPIEIPRAPIDPETESALQLGRYVPLFGWGATEDEARRVVALVSRAFSTEADPRVLDGLSAMLLHPTLGTRPMAYLAEAIRRGRAPAAWGSVALGAAGLLGAGDAVRAEFAEPLLDCPAVRVEALRTVVVAGAERFTFPESYARLCAAEKELAGAKESEAFTALRAWFELILARRWAALDVLREARLETLPAADAWLVAAGLFLVGDEGAKSRMTEYAAMALEGLQPVAPRAVAVLARELAELVSQPWALRWDHLRCAAAKDHASAAIRAWLSAALYEPHDEVAGHDTLGPEMTKAAKEARALVGGFLLDWFVQDREARSRVDHWVGDVLRVYHRLHGASLLGRVLDEVVG